MHEKGHPIRRTGHYYVVRSDPPEDAVLYDGNHAREAYDFFLKVGRNPAHRVRFFIDGQEFAHLGGPPPLPEYWYHVLAEEVEIYEGFEMPKALEALANAHAIKARRVLLYAEALNHPGGRRNDEH